MTVCFPGTSRYCVFTGILDYSVRMCVYVFIFVGIDTIRRRGFYYYYHKSDQCHNYVMEPDILSTHLQVFNTEERQHAVNQCH